MPAINDDVEWNFTPDQYLWTSPGGTNTTFLSPWSPNPDNTYNLNWAQWYVDITTHGTMTLYARDDNGDIIEDTYARAHSVPGTAVTFTVVIGGTTFASNSYLWSQITANGITSFTHGVAIYYNDAYPGYQGFEFQVGADAYRAGWGGLGRAPVTSPAFHNVLPVLELADGESHMFVFNDMALATAPAVPPLDGERDISTVRLTDIVTPLVTAHPWYWTWNSPVLHYEGNGDDIGIYDLSWPDNHGLMWNVTFTGGSYMMQFDNPLLSITFECSSGGVGGTVATSQPNPTSDYYNFQSPPGEPTNLRIRRSGNVFVFEYSTGGSTWAEYFQTEDLGTPEGTPGAYEWSLWIHDIGGVMDWRSLQGFVYVPPPVDPPPVAHADETVKTPRAARTVDPNADSPAKEKSCTTLLDLIREFSAAVRCPVRVINGSTIEMVDPNEPLPTGWVADGGDEYYSHTTQTVAATTKALQLSKGYMDLTVAADLVANEAGLLTGGFRIPARLPGPPRPYGLPPAPVTRVSYTMTPKEFHASVDLMYPDTPLIVRDR